MIDYTTVMLQEKLREGPMRVTRRDGCPLRKAPRYLTVLLVLLAIVVAGNKLAAQQTAASEVLLTGLYVFGGVAVLFGVLIGMGKGLGALVSRARPAEDDEN